MKHDLVRSALKATTLPMACHEKPPATCGQVITNILRGANANVVSQKQVGARILAKTVSINLRRSILTRVVTTYVDTSVPLVTVYGIS
jgi:hypothetical protein